MVLSSPLQITLLRYQHTIDEALRSVIGNVAEQAENTRLDDYYGQMQYHIGWVDSSFRPVQKNTGKMLRPTLLLLAYEAAGSWGMNGNDQDHTYLQRALPAAVSVELTHNFTLIHDDIEDGDTERRHRATAWHIWGVPQAINTGDGMFALARLALWDCLQYGVEPALAAQIAQLLDRDILTVAEGQHLDMSFEQQLDISVAQYIDMITRKTAVLMGSATHIGALLGTQDQETIQRLYSFGRAVGIAFQIRDDILGVWASSQELGKTQAGDIYRKKKSFPILHALEHANAQDKQELQNIYQQEGALHSEQVATVLSILEHTQTKSACQELLRQHCQIAHTMLNTVPQPASSHGVRALQDMENIIQFIEETGH